MNQSIFKKDPANKKIHVSRVFNAGLARTWAAWSEAELLDQWWAPKPWKAVTKKMDFSEVLLLLFLKAKAKFGWNLSNLAVFLRLHLLVKIDLWDWLDDPFFKPHEAVVNTQQKLL